MVGLLFVSMVLIAREAAEFVASQRTTGINPNRVVIDAGHGADDGGKIGINGAVEKDINLLIALRVKELLKAQGVDVVMTREDDAGLYPKTGENRKLRDMQKRVELINKERAALTVSIHQNSYTDERVSGAQTFYMTGCKEGKRAAEILQEQMIVTLAPDKERVAKENGSYYLLKQVKTPIVIAECGFLSNAKEAELLCDAEYQEKVAWAIHLGILRYLNSSPVQE
jgi:N-acetylmuramoyl-L-alanine amidase